jgi:hypothetical protein
MEVGLDRPPDKAELRALLHSPICRFENKLDPNWTPSVNFSAPLYARNPRVSGGFFESGRLDLNQRPFGPQLQRLRFT